MPGPRTGLPERFRAVEIDAVAFCPSLMVEPGLLKEKVTPESNTINNELTDVSFHMRYNMVKVFTLTSSQVYISWKGKHTYNDVKKRACGFSYQTTSLLTETDRQTDRQQNN